MTRILHKIVWNCVWLRKKCFVLGLEALNKFDFLPDVETPAPSRLGRDAQQVGDISRKKIKLSAFT